MPHSFLIVEDHPLYASALKVLIGGAFKEVEVVLASSIDEARGALAAARFDLVLLDLKLPDARGLEGLIELKAIYPELAFLIITAHSEPHVASTALICGASGCVSKSTPGPVLVRAIADVLQGRVLSRPLDHRAAAPASNGRELPLSGRQLRVLDLMARGLLNKQIAEELNVSEATIKAHVSAVLQKFGVFSRSQAVCRIWDV